LVLQNYDVLEAEIMQQALELVENEKPDVVITDLQMRTETEGLDLITAVQSTQPLMPIITISAVGTLEQGAQAQKFGASSVLSKSRIEDEIDRLYTAIDSARADRERAQEDSAAIGKIREQLEANGHEVDAAARERLRSIMANP